MKRLLEENDVLESFKEIISCLISLLRKVDLSMYGEKSEEHQSLIENKDNKIAADMLRRHQTSSIHNPDLVITSEVEITHIIDGLKVILYECLGIENEHETIKEEFNYLDKNGDDDN